MKKIISGSNALLVGGEKCIRAAEDVLQYYPQYQKLKDKDSFQQLKMIPPYLKPLYDSIDKKGRTIEEIRKILKKPASEILADLTILEMQGLVKRYPGNIFVHT